MKKKIEHAIDLLQIQSLLEGKRIVLEYGNMPTVVLHPPKSGRFLSDEDFFTLKQYLPESVIEMLISLQR